MTLVDETIVSIHIKSSGNLNDDDISPGLRNMLIILEGRKSIATSLIAL
jgi:hypothetical protein